MNQSAAPCHPHRIVYSSGKCRSCYDAARYERRPELREKMRAAQSAYGKARYVRQKSEILSKQKIDRQGLTIEARREVSLRQRYGISLKDYDTMFAQQNGVCAICQKPPRGKDKGKRLYVDHCAGTKVVRGLLCAGCNTSLGQFYHDPKIFVLAIAYLIAATQPQRHLS